MVKANKSKGKNKEASAAKAAQPANPIPTTSDMTPNKKIKKARKPKGSNKKREGASDAVVVPTTPAPAAAPASNSKAEKSEQKPEKSSGFIFMCNSRTKPECYRHRVFGMPNGKVDFVKRIKSGARLFLYDIDLRLMYGVYRASSHGGMNLAPGAFGGAFPAQVKFEIEKDCLPVPESTFKQAILENYDAKNKFQLDLNHKQVQKLLALFQPMTAAPQPAPPQFVDERRAPPQFVEERRAPPTGHVPPPSHVPPHANSYRLAHVPDAYLPPPEDQYRSFTHLTGSHLPPADDPYRSGRHLAPTHLPPPEDSYLGRAPAADSRYIPLHAPPPASDPYYPAPRYAHALPSAAQSTDPYNPLPSRYAYHQPEAARTYYSENPISYERMMPEMAGRDPNATMASGGYLRADRMEEVPQGRPEYLPQLSSYRSVYAGSYDVPGQTQPSSSVPVSSRYSFAGAAPFSAYR